jgi:purine nucleoside permease/predicted cupin superfamily sugar epimerase
MMFKHGLLLLSLGLLLACSEPAINKTQQDSAELIKVKVVVVTMFEIGQDEGDKAGEFQLWKAGQKLDTCLPFPASYHDICMNAETGVLGIVTGMGTARATAAVMALGLDPRFDLSEAYWLVAGIAGVDPEDASLGSAAWATYLVDGDLAHEIDAREIPEDWTSGYFPLFKNSALTAQDIETKQKQAYADSANGEVYQLNPQLTDWAYNLTKDLVLVDDAAIQALRGRYPSYPNALRPPFVLKGDQLAAGTFWHGKLLNDWANNWTKYWTHGQGNFVTSGMEDTGSYQAISFLHQAGKADKNRFMVLRTASNYAMQPDDLSAAQNLAMESTDSGFAGLNAALNSAYLVGSHVVNDIVKNWSVYQHNMPYESDPKTLTAQQSAEKIDEINQPRVSQNKPHLTTEDLVKALQLEGHVEGGYFRQTFKAEHRPLIATANGERVTMTSIYYLLSAQSPIGHFHMNQSDIVHYFHAGDPITYYLIHADGQLETVVMGSDPSQGQQMQLVVKGGTWKASKIPTDGEFGYGLIGEAVAPGFEYADMQLGEVNTLSQLFPEHADLIKSMTR